MILHQSHVEQTVDRDEAVSLLASLAWRGLAGFPLVHQGG